MSYQKSPYKEVGLDGSMMAHRTQKRRKVKVIRYTNLDLGKRRKKKS